MAVLLLLSVLTVAATNNNNSSNKNHKTPKADSLLVNVQDLFTTTTTTTTKDAKNINNNSKDKPTTTTLKCDACHRFDGIGGLSGGGGTSRLLLEYPLDAQKEVLDFLFLPNYGASLHLLKVEIGGDAQSTDGSESTHMHSEDDLNFNRGYEWWLLNEAKRRNPHILTYGLAWAWPGWITTDPENPFQDLNKATNYTLQWVKGAREIHGIEIDYLGVWNEIGTSRDYLLALRKVLDQHGFDKIKLVTNDGQPEELFPHLHANDTEYVQAVDIFGFHYPHDDHTDDWILANSFDKPIWSSEESSSYNDNNGAACWARVMASHYVLNNMTANIMWNLLGSYYHGTNWYASSMLTAVQPWTGYYEYEQMPVVWVTAHYTQFLQPGWYFLPTGHGSGELKSGGYYLTLVSPDVQYFTVIVVKISRDHASCTRPRLWEWDTQDELFNITIQLPATTSATYNRSGNDNAHPDGNSMLQTWYSNLEQEDTVLFEKLDRHQNGGMANTTSKTTNDGLRSFDISLNVTVGSVFTVTNQANVGLKGQPKIRRKPNAQFPLPYKDDFDDYDCNNCYSKYLSDQMGAFEIQFVDDVVNHDTTTTNQQSRRRRRALVQMTPQLPVMWWQEQKDRGPVTVIGMTEWEDVQATVSFRLPDASSAACVATRTNQFWETGVSLCANSTHWFLQYGGAALAGFDPSDRNTSISYGRFASRLSQDKWHNLTLTTNEDQLEAVINGMTRSTSTIRVGDSGFVALGTSAYAPVQFGHLEIKPAGRRWSEPEPFVYEESAPWSLTLDECTPNGFSAESEQFEVTANWQIRHVISGRCVTVMSQAADRSKQISLTLQPCKHDHEPQQFRHEYTLIRNGRTVPLKNALGDLCATREGQVSLTTTSASDYNNNDNSQAARAPTAKVTCAGAEAKGSFFNQWTVYPNTQQLRVSFGYTAEMGGRSMCLIAKHARGPMSKAMETK